MSTSKFKTSSFVFFASTLGTLITHLYLTQQHISIKYTAEAGSAMCNISDTLNCTNTILSPFSEILNVPLSIFGIITTLFIIVFGLKSLYLDQDPKSSTAVTLGLSLFAVAASIIMAFVSLLVVKSLCPFCTLAYFLSFVTFFAALQWTTGFKITVLTHYFKKIVTQLVLIAVVGFITGKVVLSSFVSPEMEEMMSLVVADWKSKPAAQDIQLVDPLVLGPDSAKMKILEFSDFLCSHCKEAYPKFHNFAKTHKNDVQIIFQNFPLDGCSGTQEAPGKRCDIAKIAYCAQKQNKGWDAQEYLFSKQQSLYGAVNINEEIPKISQFLMMDANQLQECFKSPETLKTIKAQHALGLKLKVQGTPAVFINNKFLNGGPHTPTFQQILMSL